MSAAAYFLNGTDIAYWVSGTSYASGKVARSPTDHQLYVRIIAGGGATDPASDTTNWRPDGGRPIKSIQRGVSGIAAGGLSIEVTISEVNTAKSELRYLGSGGTNANGAPMSTKIRLTNSTTLTAESSNGISYNNSISWELTEYY